MSERQIKEKTNKDYSYKARVKRAINIDPHIYNILVASFQGGYTHANYIYADEVLKNGQVDLPELSKLVKGN